MTVTESISAGILIALIVWIVKSTVGWVLKRKAISEAIMLDIKSRIELWRTNDIFLEGLVKEDSKEGGKIPYSALFAPSKNTLFNSLLSQLITFLPDKIAKISKLYDAFREADELLSGILRDITIWREKEHILDSDDIKYLRAKKDRISSYVSIFTKNPIVKLSDLPTDYRGIQGTEAITGTIPSESTSA